MNDPDFFRGQKRFSVMSVESPGDTGRLSGGSLEFRCDLSLESMEDVQDLGREFLVA